MNSADVLLDFAERETLFRVPMLFIPSPEIVYLGTQNILQLCHHADEFSVRFFTDVL
ncbi:MAG: hypothetical protein ACREX9_20805 [Gammaproteobacteria bacterium]